MQGKNDTQVKLKHIMGIHPGMYLTVLYSLILLIILFFLLVYPGLKNPGSVLIVKTEPAGAAIRVNDVYMGQAGTRIFVPRGTHTIDVVMPGFESQNTVIQIKGRIFGSLLFAHIHRLEFTLRTNDPVSAFILYAADFAEWSFAGEPTASWQIPLSLSEGAYRLGPQNSQSLQDILRAAARFTSTRAALRDLLRAKILLDNYGNAPSPAALLGSISEILVFLSENPDSASWLHSLLPQQAALTIENSGWHKDYEDRRIVFSGRTAERQRIRGLNFLGIPDTEFSGGNQIKGFLISETPVTKSLFETFLGQNPEWTEHYTDYFTEEISINPLEAFNRDAITGITWYAAQAFCKWLTAYLPGSMAGMEIRLPSEYEWLAAAQRINNMNFPGFEWCIDPYTHIPYLKAKPNAIEALGSPERSILGRVSITSMETRTSLPPGFSSPFVTFRAVIAPITVIAEKE
jgi:hypothetical protein